MHLAYIDESGNTGKGSRTYTLGCVLVEGERWPETFDRLIAFRRHIRRLFGVPVRAEIKANHLLRNGGAFRPLGLSESARFAIYRQHMRLQDKLDLKTFAVVIDKNKAATKYPGRPVDDIAWEYLLQRLERFTTKGNHWTLVVHDEGNALAVRKIVRKSRRAGTAGSMMGTGGEAREPSRQPRRDDRKVAASITSRSALARRPRHRRCPRRRRSWGCSA